jgi:hypothetical protein
MCAAWLPVAGPGLAIAWQKLQLVLVVPHAVLR